jgi:hypothetical protein
MTGGAGGLAMIGLGMTLALTGRHEAARAARMAA